MAHQFDRASLAQKKQQHKVNALQRWKEELTLLVCIVGIYVVYIYYAVLQERITCTVYGEGENTERFNFIMSLLFIQTIANSIASAGALFVGGNYTLMVKGTYRIFLALAFTYLGGMWSSYAALDYVSFPTTVLVKSCKMIPVMIMGIILLRTKYSITEWACMLMVSGGIAGFMYLQGGNSSKTNSTYGLALTLLSLSMDGATGAIQDRIVGLKITTHQMMFGINAMSIVWLSGVLAFTGEATEALAFTVRHPEIWTELLTFCVVSAVGQNFIFLAVNVAGALTCSIITTTRKFFTILLSVVWFRHSISWSQWAAVVVVFVGLIWDVQTKYAHKQRRKAQQQAQPQPQQPPKDKAKAQ